MNKKNSIGITTAAFAFEMDASQGLKAISWQNKLSGETLALGGGAELGVVLDHAKERIWIEGWHQQRGDREAVAPDEESGFRAGWHLPGYPDIHEHIENESRWWPGPSLIHLFGDATYWSWARTRVFLPERLAGEPITLKLGGFGVGDFAITRAFVNGHFLAERRPTGRWFEPGKFVVKPGDPVYERLRFGQINIIALQLGGSIDRNLRLDEKDPAKFHHWPYTWVLQPAYFQHLEAGNSPEVRLSFAFEDSEREEDGGIRIVLAAREAALKAEINYRPADDGKTLLKSVVLTNTGDRPLRVADIELGDYKTKVGVSEGDMGFPVHLGGSAFMSLDHPAGYAMGQNGRVRLRQFPGIELAPGASFSCMTAVYGVAPAGQSREAFLVHITSRMRRVRRSHDKPYAIMSMFGSWPIPPDISLEGELSEETCLHWAEWLKEFKAKTGETFDLVNVDFWQDPTADLIRFNQRFPEGFARAKAELTRTGARHGLWIDGSGFARWNIGMNPLMKNARWGNPSYAQDRSYFTHGWGGQNPCCWGSEIFHSVMGSAFRHHVGNEGVRLLKFDNTVSVCHNQHHGHWPGVYSTEAIYNALIAFFASMDQASPDVFLMLYWGYRSPWWLLHADMLFECGMKIEASSPAPTPSLYTRDGVAVTLDQGTAYLSDIPKLGKDSLGIWFSKWPWNSSIGKERWREGVIMDLCRGNMIFQPWMGEETLDDDDLQSMAEFMRLLRKRPECFRNSRLILGDPWKNEPYGYACSDGARAFVAVNNFAWRDYPLAFDKPAEFGLDPAAEFTVFRHYPEPARLSGATDCLRPFQVALYELVPGGQVPSAEIAFPNAPAVAAFAEPTAVVPIMARNTSGNIGKDEKTVATAGVYDAIKESTDAWRGFAVSGNAPVSQSGGTLVVCAVASRNGKAVPTGSIGSYFKTSLKMNGTDANMAAVLPDKTYPATWQAWRVGTPASAVVAPFELTVACRLSDDVQLSFQAHFIPAGVSH